MLVDTPALVKQFGFKLGVISSSNSLDYTDKCLEIMHINDASIKDMEASAIAYVAELANIPLICVKTVTDIVDMTPEEAPTFEQFLQNLQAASLSLRHALPDIIRFVSGKLLSEL